MTTVKKIAFIGAGNMAKSLIGGMVANGYPADAIYASAQTRNKLDLLEQEFGIQTSLDNDDLVKTADIIVLAVKPQIMADVCEKIAQHKENYEGKIFVSIAAGVTVARLQSLLADDQPMIRTMPNTPALVQQGLTGLYASPEVSEEDKVAVNDIMLAVGKTAWVEQESDLNTIIAATGSSPAYFFLFMQAMQESIMKMGFDAKQARALVEQAAIGSAAMVQHNQDTDLETLRLNVTSKGGATAEAIRVFEEQNLKETIDSAMNAAVNRAQEMEKLF